VGLTDKSITYKFHIPKNDSLLPHKIKDSRVLKAGASVSKTPGWGIR